jgi:dolichol-phosphate mannosyltransferase
MVSLVLPSYNERHNIVPLIQRLHELIQGPHEILVVDDGSPDGTAAAAQEAAEELPNLRVIVRQERCLTSAIQRGVDESSGQVVVWMDCDFSMPPETVPELIDRVRGGHDAAIGSRFVPGSTVLDAAEEGRLVRVQRRLTRLLNRGLSAALGAACHDWTSGFIAVRGPLIRGLRLRGDYGEYFIDLMAQLVAAEARIVEVPYRAEPRRSGQSKTAQGIVSFIRLGFRYLRAVVNARRTVLRSRTG